MRDHEAFWLFDAGVLKEERKPQPTQPEAVEKEAHPDPQLHTHVGTSTRKQVTHSHVGGDEPHMHGGPFNGDDVHCWRRGMGGDRA